MPSVTVDLSDLETLIFTTGALKTVEEALNKRKGDPFVRAHLDFTDAHNRLVERYREASRSRDNYMGYNNPLTKEEIQYMNELDLSKPGYFIYHDESFMQPRSYIMSLLTKGMVRRGRYLNGVLWDGDTHPQLKEDDKGFAVRLTTRGATTIAELRDKGEI